MAEKTVIAIKLTPKASKNAILGWFDDENGQKTLKISVTAVPENGKANKALINMLSKEYKIPKSHIRIVRGQTSTNKMVEFASMPPNFFG